MKINVGSKNATKIKGVADTVRLYPEIFPNPEVEGVDVQIELYGHPKTINETIEGAVDRAKQSFVDCEYSFGIESGLVEASSTRSGYFETTVCAIYDGSKVYVGVGPAYEWPKKVLELILSNQADGSKAFKMAGYTHEEKLGAVEGGITGFLSKGKSSREEVISSAIKMALIEVQRPEFYDV